jgi:hypothetical protein
MEFGIFVIAFLIQVIVSTILLFLAMKLTKEDGPFIGLLAAAFIAALIDFIPYAGFFISFIVLLILISRWTTAEIWPDAVLIVVVAWGLGTVATFCFQMAFA